MRLSLIALVLAASCAPLPIAEVQAPDYDRVTLTADTPGWYLFCVESPDLNMVMPGEPRTAERTVCAFTVDQLRHQIAHQRIAE